MRDDQVVFRIDAICTFFASPPKSNLSTANRHFALAGQATIEIEEAAS